MNDMWICQDVGTSRQRLVLRRGNFFAYHYFLTSGGFVKTGRVMDFSLKVDADTTPFLDPTPLLPAEFLQ